MDVFVWNVPPHATNRQVERFFEGPLRQSGITVYHVEKMRDKPLAIITVLDSAAGQRLLDAYGVPQGVPGHVRGRVPLQWDRRFVQISRSRNSPSDFSLKSLAYENSQRAAAVPAQLTRQGAAQNSGPARFAISDLQCGMWDFASTALAFSTHYRADAAQGSSITFGHKEAIVLLGDTNSEHTRVDFNYYNVEHVVLGSYQDPTISLTLNGTAPKIYRVQGEDVLSAQLTALVIGNSAAKAKNVRKTRLTSIDDSHSRIAGVCFTYRVTLSDHSKLSAIRGILNRSGKMPSTITMPTSFIFPPETWRRTKERLDLQLSDANLFGTKPFTVRFQIDRLARNGILSPTRVLELLPKVNQIYEKYGTEATLGALSQFSRQVVPPGPYTEAADCLKDTQKAMLEDYARSYDQHAPDNPYELAKRHTHINLIHKIVVTPAGTYLEGPEPEPTNRVLREYATQTDHFVRVLFQDEDGSSVHYDPRASQSVIFHQRFKGVLDGSVNVAGHVFAFLGFSHSSLRSQSCWFMAPLWDSMEERLMFAPRVIERLGDFTHIRTPAKSAARIGQCFTDTTASVNLEEGEVGSLNVVERNGRDFSDGVGTISRELLRDVWRVYGSKRLVKPSALQIRFRGAKGMVSLDSRLRGRQLLLRSNMKKFEGSESKVLEICGAAFKPLPMVLNRQFIKILEDLGIRTQAFLQLQSEEVDKLRCMLTSAVNTSSLLEKLEGTRTARIPNLIMLLDELGLDFRTDRFLYGVVEMAVVHHLRDIKYRGRIPVAEGVTLYGIMDETGALKEGEVYVATERGPEGGRRDDPRANVIVTRSPAMHPGDVQIVNVVDVPASSPLKQLSNVVVFSQHGARDLPSQLSGGDLDGDLYNVIWDKRLLPHQACAPADYPRVKPVELDRAVTAKDMSDFFVTFMETDQLGMLCNVHMELADQQSAGTFSSECIKLAGLASTAVDYSKTGIPVNMKECPRYDRCRPDFMAPSPRVVVSEKGYLEFEEEDLQDDEAFEGFDTEKRPYRYYESPKALGHLYRAIDERKFVETMQREHNALRARNDGGSSVLGGVLTYVLKWASQYGLIFLHHDALAKDIRMSYEESLLNIMYNYCPTSHAVLSEHEVFSGSILGRQGGAQGKPLRELSQTMRQRFEAVVEYASLRMVKGDQAVHAAEDLDDLYDDREFEALPRAIACLQVAVRAPGWVDRQAGELKSFGYVAAGVCLRELQRYRITTFGYQTLPRI